MRHLCVFCGSATGNRSIFGESARELGRVMAARGVGLVFGGGHIGLMGVLADAVLEHAGEAIGVIPQALVDKELAHGRLSGLHVVATMHQRKALMADLSDAFLALPGGYGTADEFFEILTWAQLGLHRKPAGILNIEGYFDPLLAWLDRAVADGFLRPNDRRLLHAETDCRLLLDQLAQPIQEGTEKKWLDEAER